MSGLLEQRFEERPVHTTMGIIVKVTIVIALVTIIANVFGWCGETAQMVQKEVGPSALLKKYEWFKNASASLDEKVANIAVYNSRNKQYRKDYGENLSKWPRDVREQFAIWQSELSGIKASYNMLAADYNAQMAKINWAFCNIGTLPEGAEKPLPRNYKPYITE